jgi:hypothetical protein
VAFSADRDDRTTRIELDEGELQLLVGDDALGDELPEIGTPAGTVYVHEPGEYRISFDGARGLEVVVRSGYAELLTERGSTVVRAGESAWTPGDRWSRVELAQAGGYDALERWGAELDRAAEVYDERTLYVEPEYRYAAAPLQRYGSWVYVDSAWAWRPRVTVDWRPYWNGRWAHTPSGLTWVSAEPWGWLPYHYGTWYQAPGFGWCWRPGRVYSPAWVYWYVGPRWTGWCPVGYYTSHYRGYRGNGFRHGLYGWATGSWSFYSDWNFCPTPRVYDRYDRGFRHTGAHIGRLADAEPPRGLLTTDTRGLDRSDWSRGDAVVAKVARRSGHAPERLPVVTDFVARKSVLPPAVEHAVVSERRGGRRVATPLDPIAGGLSQGGSRGDDRPAPGWRSRGTGDAGGVVVGIRQPNPTPGERTRTGSGGQGEGGRGPRAEIQPIGEPERDRVVGRPEPRPQPRVEARPGGDADRGGRVEIQPIGEPDRSGSRQGWRQEAKPVERIRIVGRAEPPRS